eukprot:scaffold27622_cov19-Tisochrysis_lutea.AAC.4
MMISGGAAHAATSRPPNANSLPQRNIPAPLPRAAVCSSHTPQQPVAFSSSPCRHRRALRVYAAAEPPQAPDSTSPKQPQMGIPGLIPQGASSCELMSALRAHFSLLSTVPSRNGFPPLCINLLSALACVLLASLRDLEVDGP